MKKYNDNDVVNVCLDVCSVEDIIKQMREFSYNPPNEPLNLEDELKDFENKGYDFEGGKKYVVVSGVGCRGLYEGIKVIREGEVLYEKDLYFGSDFWKLRRERLKLYKQEFEDGIYSKEEYDKLVKLYKEGSNSEVCEYELCGCINEDHCPHDDEYERSEFVEDGSWYYYIVDRLRS